MADLKEWTSYSAIDPEFEAFLKEKGPLPEFHTFGSIAATRAALKAVKDRMNAAYGPATPPPSVKETDHSIPTRDGKAIPARVYTPTAPAPEDGKGRPLAVVYHGGGFCLGSIASEELTCRKLCAELGVVCVNVEYRLAPEHPFPTAVEDAEDAAKWAISQASSLGASPSTAGFLLSGCSAGGNLATTTALLLRDQSFSPKVTGVHLMVPLLCYPPSLPSKYSHLETSITQNAAAPVLNDKNMDFFNLQYIPSEAARHNEPRFSPLIWPDLVERGFPKMYMQVCGMDPLRDQELIFEKILREEAGVKTKVDVYQGLPHAFWSVVPGLKESGRFVEDEVRGVRWLLEG